MKIQPVEVKRKIEGEVDGSEQINISKALVDLVRAVNQLIEIENRRYDLKKEKERMTYE